MSNTGGGIPVPRPAGLDPQPEKLLDEAMKRVKREAFQMKMCLDKSDIMEALKHCSTMLGELRTAQLPPKLYYELYMSVNDELSQLQMFLTDEIQRNSKIGDLYELVQYAGYLVPRLYMLVTVGVAYMKAGVAPKRTMLQDLVEMCRGVQHPLRGLFLRNYLLQNTKNLLYDGEEDDGKLHIGLEESADYILINFGEMNKLWVRMQHQGHSKLRKKREQERKELRLLVGTNLERLANLEGLNVDMYAEQVLPNILQQVIKCKEPIAQEYLMECITQVFADEMHLATLRQFLSACGQLKESVNVKGIIIGMINRLAEYVKTTNGILPNRQSESKAALNGDADEALLDEDIDKKATANGGTDSGVGGDLFGIFSAEVTQVIKHRPEITSADIVSLYGALANLVLKCYVDRRDFLESVLGNCSEALAHRASASTRAAEVPEGEEGTVPAPELTKAVPTGSLDAATEREILKMLKLPLEDYPTIQDTLHLKHYADFVHILSYHSRRAFAIYAANMALGMDSPISETEDVVSMLDLVRTLVTEQDDGSSGVDHQSDEEDLAEGQIVLAKLIHLFTNDVADHQFLILETVRKTLMEGGPKRIKYTMPPLIFKGTQLVKVYMDSAAEDENWQRKCQKILQFCNRIAKAVLKADPGFASLRMFLQVALVANGEIFKEAAYDFFTQALTVYEEEISDSKTQMAAIKCAGQTLIRMTCFTEEDFSTLAGKLALYAAKLLKKPDQCRSIALVSHVFWSGQKLVPKAGSTPPAKDEQDDVTADESEQNGDEEKKEGGDDEQEVPEEPATVDASATEYEIGYRHNSKRVLECLQRCLKIANTTVDAGTEVLLYVEILNEYLYYYMDGNDAIYEKDICNLVDLINTNKSSLDASDELYSTVNTYYQHTINYLRKVREDGTCVRSLASVGV
eukprot:Clim_evm19s236 gene=Clim_evmTU19s236